jgi:adenosylcobinamide-GDP ribazoletransferase
MARRNFGGISGDLAGWFLQTAELWMLGAACTAQYLEPFFRRLL